MNEEQIAEEAAKSIWNALCDHYNPKNIVVTADLYDMIKSRIDLAVIRAANHRMIEEVDSLKKALGKQNNY